MSGVCFCTCSAVRAPPRTGRAKGGRLAFTLVELLAVIGIIAVLASVALGFLKRDLRNSPGWVLGALTGTGRAMLELGTTVALAGLVVGVVQVSGLGFILSHGLVKIAAGNVLYLLFLTALVSMILGMGMPTTAVYVLLAVLVGPALTQLGIDALASHLFIFYFGMASMTTPPIALAAFAAASIGQRR